MNLERRIINVQSWWIASELLRRHHDLGVIETHPGGGQSDCLSIIYWAAHPASLLHLNRDGAIHVETDTLPNLTWQEDRRASDRHHSVKIIESRTRLNGNSTPSRTTPSVLVARVAHQVLLVSLNDRSTWDIRNVRVDTASYGNDDGDVSGFPTAEAAVAKRRADDPWGDSRYRFWHILRDGERLAVLDNDGAVHFSNGKSVDVYAKFKASHRSVAPVGAWLKDTLVNS